VSYWVKRDKKVGGLGGGGMSARKQVHSLSLDLSVAREARVAKSRETARTLRKGRKVPRSRAVLSCVKKVLKVGGGG